MKNIISLLCVGVLLLAVAIGCNSRGNSYDTGFQTSESDKKAESDRKAEDEQFIKELENSKFFVFDGGFSDLSVSGDTLKVKNSAIKFEDVQEFKNRTVLPGVLKAKGIKFIDFDNGQKNWKVTTR